MLKRYLSVRPGTEMASCLRLVKIKHVLQCGQKWSNIEVVVPLQEVLYCCHFLRTPYCLAERIPFGTNVGAFKSTVEGVVW